MPKPSVTKVKLDMDEWYPVYSISERWGHEVEVDATTLRRWKRTEKAFDEMQDEMRTAFEGLRAEKRG